MSPAAGILELDGLTRAFGRLTAVDGVSLSVSEGEIRGLIGPNGSGKTTLFNVISGFLRPTGGKVLFRGEAIAGLGPHRIARRGLVRTFQITSVYRDLSVRDNIVMGHHLELSGEAGPFGWLRGRAKQTWKAVEAHSEALLELFGLGDVRDSKAGLLPAGRQRLLSMATALAARPRMLLLDEPLAGLSAAERADAVRKIAVLRDRGLTLLLVEHDVKSVLSLCDRITVVDFGRKIAEGPPEVIARDARVIEAYLGAASGR